LGREGKGETEREEVSVWIRAGSESRRWIELVLLSFYRSESGLSWMR